jgi:threonine aldolase
MVYITMQNAPEKLEVWAAQGVRAGMMAENLVRLVTHFQITDAMIEHTLEVIGSN